MRNLHRRTHTPNKRLLSVDVFYAVMFTAGVGGLKLRFLQIYQWTDGHVVFMQDYGQVTSIQKMMVMNDFFEFIGIDMMAIR